MSTMRKFRHSLSRTSARRPVVWYRHRWLKAEDVLLASYPRSGNTWLRFLLFELLTGQPATFETINRPDSPVPDILDYRQSPPLLPGGGRLVKTHEPYRRDYRKAIYLVRDVRDVVSSEYNYLRRLGIHFTSFDAFLALFLKGKVNGYGSWDRHVCSWLEAERVNRGNILVVKYEAMRYQEKSTLPQILDFLEMDVDMKMVESAIQSNSIEAMRDREAMARETVYKDYREEISFVGEGLVGGWRQRLSESQIQLIEMKSQEVLKQLDYDLES